MSHQDVLRIAIRKFGPFERAIQKQYASFQQTSGANLSLEFEALDLNQLYESLLTSGGLRNGRWDIAFLNTDWLAEAVAAGALADISGFMHAAPLPGYPQGWPSSLLEAQQFGAAVYGTPYHDGPECLIYRKDLFEDAREQQAFAEHFGYALAVPRTWTQFYDIARFFTRPEHNLYGSVFAAYPDGHNSVYDFVLQLWSRGGELTDRNGALTLNTPQAVAALDFYRTIVKDRGASYPYPEKVDSVKSGEVFSAGKVAMMTNWFGFAAVCELPDCLVKGKVAVAPLPSSEAAREVALIVYWILAIGAGSRHIEEAYAFLRHVCTPEMDKITTLEGAIGCRFSTWSAPEVNAAIPFYHRLADLVHGARMLPRSKQLPRITHIIDEAIQAALLTDMLTATILTVAQEQAEGIRL